MRTRARARARAALQNLTTPLTRLTSHLIQVDACLFGSVPLRTYLPDGDIDVALVQRGGSAAAHTTPLGPLWADRLEAALLAAGRDPGAPFPIRHVSLIQAEVRLLKCVVGDAVVDVSFSTLGGLRAVAFLEATARAVGKNSLFKRGVLAVKAWAGYEGRLLGAHAGLLSTYSVEAMVLRLLVGGAWVPVPGVALPTPPEPAPVAAATAASLLPPPPPTQPCPYPLDTPLAILRAFLATYACFDWAHHALTVAGPVDLAVLAAPATAAALAAAPTPGAAFDLLLSLAEESAHAPDPGTPPPTLGLGRLRSLITAYGAPTAASGSGSGRGGETGGGPATTETATPPTLPPLFAAKHLNIADPLAPTNNLGRPLSKGSAARVVKALGLGSALLEAAIAQAEAPPPLPGGRRRGGAGPQKHAAAAATRATALGASIANLDGFFRNAWGARAAHYAARVLPAMRAANETAVSAAAAAQAAAASNSGGRGAANPYSRTRPRRGRAVNDRRAGANGGPAHQAQQQQQQQWSPFASTATATSTPSPAQQPSPLQRVATLAAGAGGGGCGPALDGDLAGLVLQLRVAEAAATGKPPPPPPAPLVRDGRPAGGGGQSFGAQGPTRPRPPWATRSPSSTHRAGSMGPPPGGQQPLPGAAVAPPAGPDTPSPAEGKVGVVVVGEEGAAPLAPPAVAAPPPPAPRPSVVVRLQRSPPPPRAPPPAPADATGAAFWPALPAHHPAGSAGAGAGAPVAAPHAATGPTLAQVVAAASARPASAPPAHAQVAMPAAAPAGAAGPDTPASLVGGFEPCSPPAGWGDGHTGAGLNGEKGNGAGAGAGAAAAGATTGRTAGVVVVVPSSPSSPPPRAPPAAADAANATKPATPRGLWAAAAAASPPPLRKQPPPPPTERTPPAADASPSWGVGVAAPTPPSSASPPTKVKAPPPEPVVFSMEAADFPALCCPSLAGAEGALRKGG